MKDENFPNLLSGRLWHTTSFARYQMILETGCISPNPPIPDQERWGAFRGTEYYPYVRFLGGVSLFDFNGFNHKRYSKKYPQSSWREFVPFRKIWKKAVWIEINRQKIINDFICGKALVEKWRHDAAYHHPIMPLIEAAHLGPILLDAFSRVFMCDDNAKDFKVLA